MGAVLGVTAADYYADNLYARVLSLSERGGRVLRLSEEKRNVQVLSKPAMGRKLEGVAFDMFQKSADAHDLYVLAYENREYTQGEKDWVTSPVFVRS